MFILYFLSFLLEEMAAYIPRYADDGDAQDSFDGAVRLRDPARQFVVLNDGEGSYKLREHSKFVVKWEAERVRPFDVVVTGHGLDEFSGQGIFGIPPDNRPDLGTLGFLSGDWSYIGGKLAVLPFMGCPSA